ncbi:MAG: HD domain-containing phosphohydrolase [Halanaerobiales bacterium]
MTELSLNRYINKKLFFLFLILIIIVIISVYFVIEGFIRNMVYDYMYDVTLDSVLSSLDQSAELISSHEERYDLLLSDLTRDFRDQLLLEEFVLKDFTASQYDQVLKDVMSRYLNQVKAVGLDENLFYNSYYYIIDSTGLIVRTNDREQTNVQLDNYDQISQALDRGRLLQRYINENGYPGARKHAYIRYQDDYIIKFSLPLDMNYYERISDRFISMRDRFDFLEEVAVFRGPFSAINEEFAHPTEEDRGYFRQLSEENESVRTSLNNNSFIYYTYWDNDDFNSNYLNAEPYYLRLRMDFSDNIMTITRTITLFVCGILFLAICSVFLINRHVSKKITTPFVYLAENMSKLGAYNDLTSIDERLERTDIKEVNMLLASYQEMTSELSSSFEELRAVNEELEDSYKETSVLAENLHNVIEVATKLTDTVFDDKESFLIELFYVAKKLIPEADYGTVFVVEDQKLKWLESVGHNLESIESISIKKELYSALDDVIYIKDIEKERANHNLTGMQEELLQAKRPIKSSLTVKLYVGDELAGALNYDIAQSSKDNFSNQSIETIQAFGNLASAFLTMQSYKHIHEKFQRQIILAIINMLEIHDTYTRGHSENVARISAVIAREMGYNPAQVKNIEWAGLVHDIGKILISKKILNKEGVLTADEYTQIKKHTVWGYEVLVSSDELKEIAVYVRHHHERWDGMGYPDGLKGREIPRVSRIIGLADSWDTMRSDRIYRKKLPKEVAIEELIVNRGTQFDPEVVDVALKLIEEGIMK